MAAGFTARIAERFQRLFPERQLYHRSDGRVQFVVLTPRFQIISLVTGLACISWVAYATVMTGFQSQIVDAKDERIRTLTARYDAQIAAMRLDYDDLAEKMALAEGRFENTVASIEKRQGELQTAMAEQTSAGDALDEVMQRAGTVRALGLGPDATPIPNEEDPDASGGVEEKVSPGGAVPAAPAPKAEAPKAPLKAADANAFPRSKPSEIQVATLDIAPQDDAVDLTKDARSAFASGRNVEAGKSLTALDTRLGDVMSDQHETAADIATAAADKEERLRDILEIAGMDPNVIAPRDDAVGGPFVPAGPGAEMVDPLSLDSSLDSAEDSLKRAALLQKAMLAVPLANPLPNVLRISSGFGVRSDPFNHGRAYHSGLDFKGPYGTEVKATAPGVVTVADWQGGYGRMVEIDHGYGLKTRYAHLSAISVVQGQQIAYGQVVGALGSTGRSTGPHLHYEVWYDGQARNPWNYLKAGANVLQRQS